MEGVSLELDDIQSGALHERPSPYVGSYLLLRIDDRAAGRELVRRLLPFVDSGRRSTDPAHDAWITVAFTYHGLKALGVPQDSLESFSPEFRQGMAARAAELGDVGESSPEQWEKPLGTGEVHVALAVLSPDAAGLEALAEQAREAHERLPGVEVIWRQDCYQLPTGRTSFGFKDGIGQPAVEGSGIPPSNPQERPTQGRRDRPRLPRRDGRAAADADPEVLGRNGTYVVFRKLHTRVAAYRQYLHATAASREEEALLGAKMVGRWQSGAPLALSPERDDPELGADPERNNDFLYGDDLRGFKCPAGAHARRANPRDSLDHDGSVNVRLHRMIRRGTSYGPMLPEGVLEDDGGDRGIIFVFAGAHLKRQFEFVKTQWLNDGIFIGAPAEKDPLVGPNDEASSFTIPQRPIRRRLQELPPFVVTRGGEYCFAPGLRALRWLAELTTVTEGEDMATTPTRHRPLEGARLRTAGLRRGRARPAGAPRVPRRRARRRDHAEPATRRQRDHHRDGRTADRDPGDDRRPLLGSGRDHHRRRQPRVLGRQRPAPTQEHDQGGLAAPAAGLRPHALHGAPAAQADLRRRQRDRLRRRLRDRAEHRLHHRLRERHLRSARSDDRPRGRRRLTSVPAPPAAAGKALQMLMTGDPITARRGVPARDGQRAPPSGRADGCRAPDRREDRGQLPDRRPVGETCGSAGRGATDRAGDRDHDGRALALGRPPRPHRGHRRLQRGPRPDVQGPRLLNPHRGPNHQRGELTMAVADELDTIARRAA